MRAGAPGGFRPATSAGPAGTRPEGGPGGGTGSAAPPRGRRQARPRPSCAPPQSECSWGAPALLPRGWEGPSCSSDAPRGTDFLALCPGREPEGRPLHPERVSVRRIPFFLLKVPTDSDTGKGSLKFSKSLRSADCALNSFFLPCLWECDLI